MFRYMHTARGAIQSLMLAMLLTACGATPEEGGMGMMGGRGPIPVVTVQAVSETFTDSFSALGNVRANEAVEIRSRISSVVTAIHFEEGQQVQQGDLLVELDNREVAAELAVAQAAYDKVKSQYDRSKSLRATQVVSAAELEELAADVRKAAADVTVARTRLDHCSIRAPIAGVVGLRHISQGGLVNTETMITTLDDLKVVRLVFGVPEMYLATISSGMEVLAATNVYPGKEFKGTVISIDSRVDAVTRSVTVVAELANDEAMLKPGMFMNVGLQRSRENVVLIPEQSLAPRSGRQYVFVIEDGVATEKEVSLGVRAPGRVEITAGLVAGETVVIEGVQKLRSGSQVVDAGSSVLAGAG